MQWLSGRALNIRLRGHWFLLCCVRIGTAEYVAHSTANIKVLRGSLGALSVNKLSHIPKLQPISAVYENQ